MQNEDIIVNRVASSGLITLNLEDLYQQGERVQLDLKDQLYQGLILKEKEFRAFVKNNNWQNYEHKYVAIACSADAIVPTWAFMLVAGALTPVAKAITFGSLEDLETYLFRKELSKIDWSFYENEKVVVKGCSKINIPTTIYVELTALLKPLVSSLMFGEPCSTVPIYKKAK